MDVCQDAGEFFHSPYAGRAPWSEHLWKRVFTGWADTDGVKRSLPRFRKILKAVLRDTASGGDTAIWLAATRPPQPQRDVVWFDRKPRTTHVYERTRLSKETPQSLALWLDQELARYPDALP